MADTMKVIISVALELPPGADYRAAEADVVSALVHAQVDGVRGATIQTLSWDAVPESWWAQVVRTNPIG